VVSSTSANVLAVEPVGLTVVASESEAEVVCGLLRANGLQCSYRQTNFGAGAADGFPRGGPVEVLVSQDDLGEAQRLLAGDGR
jgi:hypothetical protein